MPTGTPADEFWGRTMWSCGGFGSFARQILLGSLQGGFGAILERFGVENQPKKSFGMCLGVLWEGIDDVST